MIKAKFSGDKKNEEDPNESLSRLSAALRDEVFCRSKIELTAKEI